MNLSYAYTTARIAECFSNVSFDIFFCFLLNRGQIERARGHSKKQQEKKSGSTDKSSHGTIVPDLKRLSNTEIDLEWGIDFFSSMKRQANIKTQGANRR